MNESRIRIFSAARIQFPQGHHVVIEEAPDEGLFEGVFDLKFSDPKKIRIRIDLDLPGEKGSVHTVYLDAVMDIWRQYQESLRK